MWTSVCLTNLLMWSLSLLLPALSSLSSQSPPSSPFITPSAENPPPLLPAQTAHLTDLTVSQHKAEKAEKAVAGESQQLAGAETETEPLCQSEDESESLSQSLSSPWEPRVWPEGRQVLTHLVEGFVIQEGLQPFPVRTHTQLQYFYIKPTTAELEKGLLIDYHL